LARARIARDLLPPGAAQAQPRLATRAAQRPVGRKDQGPPRSYRERAAGRAGTRATDEMTDEVERTGNRFDIAEMLEAAHEAYVAIDEHG